MVGPVLGNPSLVQVAGSVRPGAAAPSAAGEAPASAADEATAVALSADGQAAAAEAAGATVAAAASGRADPPGALSPAELRQVEQLKARDREVRAHELAHQAAAGGLATGGASFTFQRGPDGVSYAIGGEVPIALREGRTPAETIANARTIRAAALAPADPSPQDRAVAAAAGQFEAQARAELAEQKALEASGQEGAAATGLPAAAGDEPGGAAVASVEPGSDGVFTGPGLEGVSPAQATAVGADRRGENPADNAQDISAAAIERRRAGLADLYGLIAANSTGFSAQA